VQRAVWNNGSGLRSCQLLVSGTARGLEPGGIETLREEVDGDGEIDMDDDEGSSGEGEGSDGSQLCH